MSKVQIGRMQMVVLFFLYILANDLIRGIYTYKHTRDEWIVVAVGIVVSLVLFSVYYLLYRIDSDVIVTLSNELGPIFSKIVFGIYIVYFLFIGFCNIRDLVEIVQLYLIEKASFFILTLTLLLTVLYVLNKGLEVFLRVCSIMFYFLCFVFFLFMTLSVLLNPMHVDNLFPILENGFSSIVVDSLKMGYSIPFGELFVILFILKYVVNGKKNYKFGYLGIVISGIALLTITVFTIVFVGIEAMQFEFNPSMRLSRTIDIKQYLQRFDLIIINVLVLHVIVKISVIYLATKDLWKTFLPRKKDITFYLVNTLILLVMIFYLAKNYVQFMDFRQAIVIPYINLTFEVILPIVLILYIYLKRFMLVKRLK